jgi:predicted phage tail protein
VYVAPSRFIHPGVVVISSIVLICAVLASLAVGVLVAYGVCMAMFGVFRIHARQVAESSARRVVASTQVAEG